MSEIQGTTTSSLGKECLPAMLAGVQKAKDLKTPTSAANKRPRAVYLAEQVTINVVADRLAVWQKQGYPAKSGVETFYHKPTAQQRTDSVATLLFNAWAAALLHRTFDDEGASFNSMVAIRGLTLMLAGRGAKNPKNQARWKKDAGERALFDVVGTDVVERSDELLLIALTDALGRPRSKPVSPGLGGFGTWGDPRKGLMNSPRPGGYTSVDAAHPHAIRSIQFPDTDVCDLRYNHSPSMRVVMALYLDGRVKGVNILPGGQSALTNSPFFADQARAWLGNQVQPVRFSVDDVVAGATGREVYVPGGAGGK